MTFQAGSALGLTDNTYVPGFSNESLPSLSVRLSAHEFVARDKPTSS